MVFIKNWPQEGILLKLRTIYGPQDDASKLYNVCFVCWPGFEITISIVHDYRARFSCTIFVHDRTIFSQSCTIFVPRLSCHDFHYFIDFSLEHIQFLKFFWSLNFLHHEKSLLLAKSVGYRSCKNLIFIKRSNTATMAFISNFQNEKLCFLISTILHDFIIEHENRASTIRARSCTIDKLDMHENRARNTIGFLARFRTLVSTITLQETLKVM